MALSLKAKSWSQTFGNKVKQGVELAGTAKAVWDTGKNDICWCSGCISIYRCCNGIIFYIDTIYKSNVRTKI